MAVGAVCLVAAAWGLGRMMGRPYRLRVTVLEQGLGLLAQLRPEIAWHHRILVMAFQRASRPYPLWHPMVQTLADQIERHETDFASAFHEAVAEVPGLWQRDREVWDELGSVLGQSAVEYQMEHLHAAEELLMKNLSEAQSQGLKTARMTEILMSCAGAALAILLI
jgi:stage III sporulation protein AB